MFGNMQNNNFMFPLMMANNANNVMTGMNIGGNQFWQNAYGGNMQQNMNGMNNQQSFSNNNKINVVFKTTGGLNMNVFVDFGTPLCDVLSLFLKRVGKYELYAPNSGIYFLNNARKVNIYDTTPIQNLFGGLNPTIIVNDVKNLIGAY